jgi:hypothetical protein
MIDSGYVLARLEKPVTPKADPRHRRGELEDTDPFLLAGAVRETLANLGGQTSLTAKPVPVSGSGVESIVRSRRRLIDARSWATAQGFSYSYDAKALTITMMQGEMELFAPLASKKLRVNGKWVKMEDIVCLKNDKVYMPLKALEKHLVDSSSF